MKRIIGVVASAALLCGFGISAAPTASAASYGCSGSVIDTYPVYADDTGVHVSDVILYYSPANNGTNCVVNVATSEGGYGTRHWMAVGISVCGYSPGTCPNENHHEGEEGAFQYYAGPKSIYSTNGECLKIRGVNVSPNNGTGIREEAGVHCG
ncbi:hypothetical protein [Kitasatospora sp. NPDC088346]|uniref:hypothetical protein n=1 Tax=Kitasatospora sp. NPDC088346 TaxID=3364073 RepID=UPI0037FDE813